MHIVLLSIAIVSVLIVGWLPVSFQHQLTGSISVVGNKMAESMDCDAVTVVGISLISMV